MSAYILLTEAPCNRETNNNRAGDRMDPRRAAWMRAKDGARDVSLEKNCFGDGEGKRAVSWRTQNQEKMIRTFQILSKQVRKSSADYYQPSCDHRCVNFPRRCSYALLGVHSLHTSCAACALTLRQGPSRSQAQVKLLLYYSFVGDKSIGTP